jgi:polyisoprenyl-phosphate glycosyltransferase
VTPLVSVVGPVMNEAGGIRQFHERITTAMEAIEPPVRHEIVLVDDGSTDDSVEIMEKLCADDPRVRLLVLSRNFGHQIAITAGIDHADGDAVVVMDTDLQDPPEVIATMVERWREGNKVVYGVRAQRTGESRFKLFTAKVFYRLVNRLSDVELPLDSGDFRLMDRQVVQALCEIREENRYIRGLVSWVGFKQCAVEYERDARFAGDTKFTFRRMLRFALDGITSFSEKPLRLAIQLGALTTFLALSLALWITVAKLIRPDNALPGFASLMVVTLFFGGVQLLSIGLLGEYVGRIYREAKRRPLYLVAERQNFDPAPDER